MTENSFHNLEQVKKHSHDGISNQKINFRDLNWDEPLTATPTYAGTQGEIRVVDDGSTTREICVYLNGTWYCATLT